MVTIWVHANGEQCVWGPPDCGEAHRQEDIFGDERDNWTADE